MGPRIYSDGSLVNHPPIATFEAKQKSVYQTQSVGKHKLHAGLLCTYLLLLEKRSWHFLICSVLRGSWLLKSTCPPAITNCCDGKHPFHPAMFVSHSTRDGTALNIVKTIQAKLCHGSLIFQTGAKPEEQVTNSECVRQNPISPRFSKIQGYYILSYRFAWGTKWHNMHDQSQSLKEIRTEHYLQPVYLYA